MSMIAMFIGKKHSRSPHLSYMKSFDNKTDEEIQQMLEEEYHEVRRLKVIPKMDVVRNRKDE